MKIRRGGGDRTWPHISKSRELMALQPPTKSNCWFCWLRIDLAVPWAELAQSCSTNADRTRMTAQLTLKKSPFSRAVLWWRKANIRWWCQCERFCTHTPRLWPPSIRRTPNADLWRERLRSAACPLWSTNESGPRTKQSPECGPSWNEWSVWRDLA